MISRNECIYFSIVCAVLLLSVISFWFALVIPGIDRWSKRFFIINFIAFLLYGLSYICEVIFQYYGITRAVFIALLLLESKFIRKINDLLHKASDRHPAAACSMFQAYTFRCKLYDVVCPAIAASSDFDTI